MIFHINGLIFDLDKTIISWKPTPKLLLRMMSDLSSIKLRSRLRLEQERERGIRLHPNAQFSRDKRASIIEESWLDKEACSPELLALLKECDQKGIQRAVVSDNDVINKLRAINLLEGWSTLVSCRALGCLKPLPDGIQAACAQMGLHPAEVLVIGDRVETDGLAAFRAGAQFLPVSRLDMITELRKLTPD
jgi:HAD superfamily hydrolase (TIGR01549 family)